MVNIDYPENWQFPERLEHFRNSYYSHAPIFAGRKVEEFNPEIKIKDSVGKAFTFRYSWDKEKAI